MRFSMVEPQNTTVIHRTAAWFNIGFLIKAAKHILIPSTYLHQWEKLSTNYQPGLILILTCDYIHLDSSSDVDVDKPDEKSIMTYVAQFLKHHPDRKQSDSDRQLEEEVTTYQISLNLDMSFTVFSLSASSVFCLSHSCHS